MSSEGEWTSAPRLALAALGFSCIITQLALIRELLAAFSGNEMLLGIILGFWLLLMGVGSWSGRGCGKLADPLPALAALQLWLAVVPFAQVFLLRALRNVVFSRGADVGLAETMWGCGLLLLPYCVPAGFALALGCVLLARSRGPAGIGAGYVLDSLGTILGGLLFSLVFVHFFDHFRALIFPAAVNCLAAAVLVQPLPANERRADFSPQQSPTAGRAGIVKALRQWGWLRTEVRAPAQTRSGGCAPHAAPLPGPAAPDRGACNRWLSALAVALGVGVVASLSAVDLDEISTRLQFPGQRILARANSPYGRLLVTGSGRQINFIENGIAFTSTRDEQRVEETVHYAMAQRSEAGRVLLVSGGISGTGLEILRAGAKHVDYVELDPLVLELGRAYVPQNLADERLRIINTDPRLHLKRTRAPYDVIIIDLPAPSTAQLNRFYTVEFLREAKRALAPNGVLSFALGQYENYISPELGRLLSCARGTLQGVFTNTLLIPGGRVFFLGSDGPLYSDIAARIEARGLRNQWVKRAYLEAMLAPDRLEQVAQGSARAAPVNKDFSPVLYYLHLRHWLAQFSFIGGLVPGAVLIALAVYLVRLRGSALVLFASGFAGSALELVLLLAFQVLCGSVYHQVAIIVTAFMAGLALGAWLGARTSVRSNIRQPGPFAFLTQRSVGNCCGLKAARRNPLCWLALALAVYSLALPWLLAAVKNLGSSPAAILAVKTAICLLTAALGMGLGAQFSLATRREPGAADLVVSRFYTADFLGAFVGAVLAGTLLIPVIGVTWVCVLTGALNVGAAWGGVETRKR
ncbi:MAG TPA: hypothetical protein VJA21_13325 [Verrucomicrobiae bacterium]